MTAPFATPRNSAPRLIRSLSRRKIARASRAVKPSTIAMVKTMTITSSSAASSSSSSPKRQRVFYLPRSAQTTDQVALLFEDASADSDLHARHHRNASMRVRQVGQGIVMMSHDDVRGSHGVRRGMTIGCQHDLEAAAESRSASGIDT